MSFSSVQMKPVARNGNTYLEIVSLSWKFVTSKLHIKLDNLFNGDKVLGKYFYLFLWLSDRSYDYYYNFFFLINNVGVKWI